MWLVKQTFENDKYKDFSDLIENNIVWLKLTNLSKLKSVALEAAYLRDKNLLNVVKLLDDNYKR